jgi:hypothetical protein
VSPPTAATTDAADPILGMMRRVTDGYERGKLSLEVGLSLSDASR